MNECETPTRSTRDERLTRLLDASQLTDDRNPKEKLYAHSVFAQACLPYRNPGDDVRAWSRVNGQVGLRIEAGTAWNPDRGDFVEIGLPYGPKPRLLLAYLNAEALRTGSAEIEVERSLTAFVKAIRLDTKGRNINAVKDQLTRLSASTIRLGMTAEGEAVTIKSDIVSEFSLWWPKDERQRVLWPSMVRLSADYFASLQKHAVPLHPHALAALAGSAMALDVYAWLAQRLHRVDPAKPQFIPWRALHSQFGGHYERVRDFRRVFTQTVRDVQSQYRAARVQLDGRGMTLHHSLTPIQGRTAIMVRKD